MGVPAGPKLDFVGASEKQKRKSISAILVEDTTFQLDSIGGDDTFTIITVSFSPLNSHNEYVLQWKEYPQKWETDCQSKKINTNEMTKTSNGKLQINIEGLNPGATYTVRLRVMAEGSKSEAGKASPELIIDTEAVSCTPKPSCIIL